MIRPVFIGASWCAPCKATKPHFAQVVSDEGLEAEYLDVEEYDSRVSDVRSVPTIRVYDGDGEVLAEHRGGATEAQVRDLFDRAAALL
ncbi:thioredoxin [Streptomyces phage Lilbooboo]|uniref:Thioredoxin n=1 Tax=Streptomyces phage Lilbooboo TaxID=2510571 RepID=A0A411B314_9CAUD|nr:thioredoxin [Streptomyces phage Lilbooboo]QAX94743.1 thioredoxin [Streptomyces phage Lilbooboo]